jgi:hypothetical protein
LALALAALAIVAVCLMGKAGCVAAGEVVEREHVVEQEDVAFGAAVSLLQKWLRPGCIL